MKRKIAASVLAVVMAVVFLCGCTNTGKDNRIKVVTTIFAPYDFTRQIAGECANITMLLKPGGEAHSYEPSPKDIIAIRNCDLFICSGGENDEWVMDILESVDNPNMRVIKMMDCVDLYEEELVPGMETEHEEGVTEDEEEWDEHVWTSPVNASIICNEICRALVETDSANKDLYEKNCAAYVAELNRLNDEFTDVIKNAPKNTVIFGDRFPLRYFVEAYGLKYYAAFPGCAQETEASAATIAFLIEEARALQIKVIFKIELSNDSMASAIAKECGGEVRIFYSCHNVSRTDFENGETYVSLMERNVTTLKEALY